MLSTAIVRLLYHQPRFAVLDEATSGLAPGVVSTVYSTFQARGIQAITLTQALVGPALRYHAHALYLGECCSSGWQVREISVQEQSLSWANSNEECAREGQGNAAQLSEGSISDEWGSGDEPEGNTPLVAG